MLANPAGVAVVPVLEAGSGVELTVKIVGSVVAPSSSGRFEGDLLADLGLLDLFCTSLVLTLDTAEAGAAVIAVVPVSEGTVGGVRFLLV